MSSDYEINLSNRQTEFPVPQELFEKAVQAVFAGEGYPRGEVGIAIVDNAEIHDCNVRFLQHDYPTDVITFPMDEEDDFLSGEIMISAEYAADEARQHGWKIEEEMTLYVVHGCLHLAGYDDHEDADRQKMRRLEKHYLSKLGIAYADQASASSSPSQGAT
ncbi:rRNA maturation RNase YbeY [Blastopirellula marina]|uniref:Endoribonuclease YbeY n=1 Tax=Blastopirellula marina TaxID=124 RepID=A0A2S8G7B6_9BACT|nr:MULTISPECIES: rRNA maturation RNase YbeY [Pirellulaceae]PQO40329.1 rRNA maturation RNase YbeY [Blastopirellula marina]RCS55877.1 rRNA maturation RNase YbeY [Bremerella cremea]